MNIGIIGAAEMGTCLASKFTTLGHSVSIANSRGPASLAELAAKIGVRAASVEEVTQDKDVIIISIPQKNVPALPKDPFLRLPAGSVVIETGNYYPTLRDGVIPELVESGIDSLWVQQQLGVPVVKVFNSILATSIRDLGRAGKGETNRIAMAVSGDDSKAKDVVFTLVAQLGFDPFDVGDLGQSWKQQPGSSIYCRDIPLEEVKKRVAAMGSDWSAMRAAILSKRAANEALMATDYPAYLKGLQKAGA